MNGRTDDAAFVPAQVAKREGCAQDAATKIRGAAATTAVTAAAAPASAFTITRWNKTHPRDSVAGSANLLHAKHPNETFNPKTCQTLDASRQGLNGPQFI